MFIYVYLYLCIYTYTYIFSHSFWHTLDEALKKALSDYRVIFVNVNICTVAYFFGFSSGICSMCVCLQLILSPS